MTMPSAEEAFGDLPPTQDPTTAAKNNGLDPALFNALVQVESGGKSGAVSDKGAVGKGQVLPSTGAQPGYGVKPFNPKDLNGSAAYLKKLIDLSGGDTVKALRMYKQGPNGNLSTPSADAYVNAITVKWKPKADDIFGADPAAPQGQSPLAKGPQALAPQKQQPPKPLDQPGGIIEAINRPADRTVELMGQDVQKTFGSIQELAKHPGVGNATMAALRVIGLPFSPVTSVVQAFAGDPTTAAAHKMGVDPKWDPLINTAVQIAAPVAATRSAVAQAAMGPAGKFLLGVVDTYDARIAAGKGASYLTAELQGMQGKAEANTMQWLDAIKKMMPANYKDMAADIAHSFEDPTHVLSTEAAAFKKQYMDPALNQVQQMAQALTQLTGQRVPWLKNYYPRNVTGTGKTFEPGVTDVRVPTQAKPAKTSPSELQERSAGGVVDPATNERASYVVDQQNGRILVMKNKQVIDSGAQIQNGVLQGGTGTQWHVGTGTMRDIENDTHLTYAKDPIADIAKAHNDVFTALANAQAVERMKVTPEFLSQARRPGQAAPDTWKDVASLDIGTHQLDGWKVSPRMQEVLHDFRSGVSPDDPQLLAKFNRAVIGSLFLNPLAHIMNVAWHSWVEKGLVSPGSLAGGAIGAALGGPGGAAVGAAAGSLIHSPREMQALLTATKAVATRDSNYMRYLKDGAGLMYASRFTRNFYQQALKMTGTQEAPSALRAAFGEYNPKALVSKLYAGSANTMWFANDIIMMQGYLANEARLSSMRMAGMAPEVIQRQAMKETEKHVPNYSVPSRIGPTALELIPGGAEARRGVAQLMQGKTGLLRFPRYDYGRVASYVNMARDTLSGMKGVVFGSDEGRLASGGDALKGMNQVMALGFGAGVVFPMVLDAFAQAVTGNKNAQWQRYGPFTVPSALYQYLQGNKDWEATASTMLPLGPLIQIGAELWYNKDLFTGRSLQLPDGAFNFLYSQFTPSGDIEKIREGKITPQQWLSQQFGIRDPSDKQVAKAKQFMEKEKRSHEKWLKENP